MRNEELQKLTEAVESAIEARYLWMQEHLSDLAEFKVGDPIFAEVASNNYKLQRAGVVAEVYVLPAKDSSVPRVCYKFHPDPSYPYSTNTETNWAYFYNEEHWIRAKQREIERLQRELK